MKSDKKKLSIVMAAMAATVGLLGLACTQQASEKPAAQTVVQAGQLSPAPAGAKSTGWDTAESAKGGLTQLATYDSSGPNAWDTKAHPLVYMTSEGMGYGHRPSETNKLPGVQVIDANTKKTVASAVFDLGNTSTSQPHGLGVSPDGQWVYIGFSDRDEGTKKDRNLILIVNAKTLKLDSVLTHPKQRLHHIMSFKDWQGRDRVVLELGFGATGGPALIVDPKDGNKVVKAITFEEVRPQGHPFYTTDPTGKYLYISMGSPEIREAEFAGAAIAKFDMEKGTTTVIAHVGNHPIGVAHTADGKFTYVADGTGSYVYKIDDKTNEVVGRTSAGVSGPYGLALNWDETELYTMGKGEGSHNTGGVVGVIDLKTFRPTNTKDYNQPVNIAGAIIDHMIVHPDPAVNEGWVSSAGTWETIIVDLATKKVKARIPTPHGGDTHSGAFVRYNPDFTGEVMADHGGPNKALYEIRKQNAAKLAAAKP